MKYFCTYCNYNYDEAFGDEIEKIKAGTKIEKLEVCPQCGETDSFLFVNEEVHYVDEFTRDIKELEHFIEVEKGADGSFKVVVAEGEHPMDDNHRICSVSLFDEYGDLIEEKFLLDESESAILFIHYDLDEFEVRVKCNKHGVFARKFENFEEVG